MKKYLFALAIALIATTTIQAQSCPEILQSTFSLKNDNVVPCLKTFSFDFINHSNGSKRIKVNVAVANVNLIQICYDASDEKDVQRTITTPGFLSCLVSDIVISLTPYNGSNCNTADCAPTIIMFGSTLLPVSFSSFTVTRSNDNVLLKWSTVSEINNKGFIVERNSNGNWEQLNFVASAALNGNSSNRIDYQYSDINYAKGMTQYRIRQIDIDNKSKYSEVRAIHGTAQVAKTVIYPNPSNDGRTNIVFETTARREIILTDMAGRMINQWRAYTANSLQVSNLLPGIYNLRFTNLETGERSMEKIVIANR